MSKRSGGTNPYMRLSDLGLLTKDHFNEVVKDALASHLSPNENVILVEHRRSPFPKVKGLFQTSLANISADDLKNKDAMFAVLKSLLDEAIEILLLQESELFYRFFSIQQLGLQLDTDEFHEAVARLRNEDFETVKKLLEDVAMSVGVEAPFNTYARNQSAKPRGRTMVDGLKPAATEELPDSIPPEPVIKEPSTQRDGLYRIPSPSQKKKRPLPRGVVPGRRITETGMGLLTGPVRDVDIPIMPVYKPQTQAEREVLAQGSADPESVRFADEPTVETVQSESGVDAEIVSTPVVETAEEDEMRPTLPDAPESIRSASGEGKDEIEDEDTWVQEEPKEPAPAAVAAPATRPKAESQLDDEKIKEIFRVPEEPTPTLNPEPVTSPIVEPPSKRAGDLKVHVPPMRLPAPSESNYKPDEPKIVLGKVVLPGEKGTMPVHTLPPELGKLPKATSTEDTKTHRVPMKKGSGRAKRVWAVALAVLTGLGAAAVAKRYFSSSDGRTETVENPHTPPAPTVVQTTAPPKPVPAPTTAPQPKTPPGPAPDSKPVTAPKEVAHFDPASVDPKNVLLKKLVEDGKFELKAHGGVGVNGQFLSQATNGANADQRKKIIALNKKLNIGVYAVAMKKFGKLTPQQIRDIKNDPTHPDHGFLISTIAISKEFKQPWSATVRVMKKNPDGTAVYDGHGQPIFEVKDYWEAHSEAYKYGQQFVGEMNAKGYANVHNVGKPGDEVAIDGVTYWADILEIMEVRTKTAGGGTGSHVPGKHNSTEGHDKKDGAPEKQDNTGGGKQGYWQPPVYNLDKHKNPTFIELEMDQNPSDRIAPNKYAKNDVFKTETPCEDSDTPINVGGGVKAVRASHLVDMNFLERDPAKPFDNLFRANHKIRLKDGETFWSVMEKTIADSEESIFVKAAVTGVLNRWRSRGADSLPFSVSQQTGDGWILAVTSEFADDARKSLAKARRMDAATAKKRGKPVEGRTVTTRKPEMKPELKSGPLYLISVYYPPQGVRPKDALIADIRRSNLSPFVEGAVLRQLDRIQEVPFTILDLKNRVYGLKPNVKQQLEFAAKIALNREKMGFAKPKPAEPLKYGDVVEMNGVPTAMEIPLKNHPVEYLEKVLVERLQTRRKVLAHNPNNMDLIGRLMDAEHQVRAKCAGMRRMGLGECVKLYVPAQNGQLTRVVWKITIVESFGRIVSPLFEKPEVSLNAVKRDPSSPPSQRPLPVPEYKKHTAQAESRRPLPTPAYKKPQSTAPDTSAIDEGWTFAA